MGDTNYFVCTLGQAALVNAENPHAFKTINDFLDRQDSRVPSLPAVGFPVPDRETHHGDQWNYEILSFRRLRQGADGVAQRLRDVIMQHQSSGAVGDVKRTVALLCPSSPVFLFTWLGLMKLGYSVLLIAPQCQPSAIAHLCKICNVSMLFYDQGYEDLATNASSISDSAAELRTLLLPFTQHGENVFTFSNEESSSLPDIEPMWQVSEHDVAYLHHTSGTSTGLPKPIAQTHRAGIGVLPCLPNGSEKATFTTTPLFHGGIADCFRAWTSDSMIWLFPGKVVPITAGNVLKSVNCTKRAAKEYHIPEVAYFSSVPYVLQMVAAEREGLATLQSMDIVGVGGAALPQVAGDELVANEINLISRFGSAECGFLMSSHRDYTEDKEWQYLRSVLGSDALRFEPRGDDLAELVILPDWPHMAKLNRDDGSYATADLFAPHASIPQAWKYHSRADSQLNLITGKKFDPAPLEAAIATSPLLSDVLIFGNGQQYPGALLFRSNVSTQLPDPDLVNRVWPSIKKLNAEGQGHTRLSKSMLVVMPSDASSLGKSSKGTILRGQAEERYQAQIMQAYSMDSPIDIGSANEEEVVLVSDEALPMTILDTIKKVMNSSEAIPPDADLFSCGVDSVACLQIRAILQKRLLNPESSALPLNVVYDCGSVNSLSRYIVDLRHGKVAKHEDETQLMKNMVEIYGTFKQKIRSQDVYNIANSSRGEVSEGDVVILTGATGALGAHILDQLRSNASISQIFCLVRAIDDTAAEARIRKSLANRLKAPLDPCDTKVQCLIARLGQPRLGLDDETYFRLARCSTVIIHAAWAVNFSMRLRSFEKDHIAGLRNLIDLALQSPQETPPHFLFCSSTASVSGLPATSSIQENVSCDPTAASSLGYSRSKWVAEAICEQAHLETRLKGKIDVLRIGQLCGDSKSGVWNVTEAWPLMLSSVKVTGSLPALNDEKLSWLPVDSAAQAVLEISLNQSMKGKEDTSVYHIVNPNRETTWTDLLAWLKRLSHTPFAIIPAKQWVEQLEGLKGDAAKHPARKLLGLWKAAYCTDHTNSRDKTTNIEFAMEKTKVAAPVMKDVKPMNQAHFEKIWHWIEGEMLGEKASRPNNEVQR